MERGTLAIKHIRSIGPRKSDRIYCCQGDICSIFNDESSQRFPNDRKAVKTIRGESSRNKWNWIKKQWAHRLRGLIIPLLYSILCERLFSAGDHGFIVVRFSPLLVANSIFIAFVSFSNSENDRGSTCSFVFESAMPFPWFRVSLWKSEDNEPDDRTFTWMSQLYGHVFHVSLLSRHVGCPHRRGNTYRTKLHSYNRPIMGKARKKCSKTNIKKHKNRTCVIDDGRTWQNLSTERWRHWLLPLLFIRVSIQSNRMI